MTVNTNENKGFYDANGALKKSTHGEQSAQGETPYAQK